MFSATRLRLPTYTIADVGRRTRLGFGPCQGTFCGYRAMLAGFQTAPLVGFASRHRAFRLSSMSAGRGRLHPPRHAGGATGPQPGSLRRGSPACVIQERKMESNRYDVVVVGAGLAGLIAASAAADRKPARSAGRNRAGIVCLRVPDGWRRRRSARLGGSPELNEAIEFFCEMARLVRVIRSKETSAAAFSAVHSGRLSRALPSRLFLFGMPSLATEFLTAIVGIRGLSSFDENFMAERRLNERARAMGSGLHLHGAANISFPRDLGIPGDHLAHRKVLRSRSELPR
jgi:hypothetical protein